MFSEEFEADMLEAFQYWCSKQPTLPDITFELWVAHIVRKPIYDLIGEKRANAIVNKK